MLQDADTLISKIKSNPDQENQAKNKVQIDLYFDIATMESEKI